MAAVAANCGLSSRGRVFVGPSTVWGLPRFGALRQRCGCDNQRVQLREAVRAGTNDATARTVDLECVGGRTARLIVT
jgi:hypothetical protein